MTYLLDTNVLIALAIVHHDFHDRVAAWIRSERPAGLATCSITELGFLRVVSQVAAYGVTVAHAKALLHQLKNNGITPFQFLHDANDITHLPAWVRTPKQITDGHLVQLAKANGVMLATLDEKIPGSWFIPERRPRTRR